MEAFRQLAGGLCQSALAQLLALQLEFEVRFPWWKSHLCDPRLAGPADDPTEEAADVNFPGAYIEDAVAVTLTVHSGSPEARLHEGSLARMDSLRQVEAPANDLQGHSTNGLGHSPVHPLPFGARPTWNSEGSGSCTEAFYRDALYSPASSALGSWQDRGSFQSRIFEGSQYSSCTSGEAACELSLFAALYGDSGLTESGISGPPAPGAHFASASSSAVQGGSCRSLRPFTPPAEPCLDISGPSVGLKPESVAYHSLRSTWRPSVRATAISCTATVQGGSCRPLQSASHSAVQGGSCRPLQPSRGAPPITSIPANSAQVVQGGSRRSLQPHALEQEWQTGGQLTFGTPWRGPQPAQLAASTVAAAGRSFVTAIPGSSDDPPTPAAAFRPQSSAYCRCPDLYQQLAVPRRSVVQGGSCRSLRQEHGASRTQHDPAYPNQGSAQPFALFERGDPGLRCVCFCPEVQFWFPSPDQMSLRSSFGAPACTPTPADGRNSRIHRPLFEVSGASRPTPSQATGIEVTSARSDHEVTNVPGTRDVDFPVHTGDLLHATGVEQLARAKRTYKPLHLGSASYGQTAGAPQRLTPAPYLGTRNRSVEPLPRQAVTASQTPTHRPFSSFDEVLGNRQLQGQRDWQPRQFVWHAISTANLPGQPVGKLLVHAVRGFPRPQVAITQHRQAI